MRASAIPVQGVVFDWEFVQQHKDNTTGTNITTAGTTCVQYPTHTKLSQPKANSVLALVLLLFIGPTLAVIQTQFYTKSKHATF